MGFWVFFFTNVFAYISVELFWIYLKLKGVSFFFFSTAYFFHITKTWYFKRSVSCFEDHSISELSTLCIKVDLCSCKDSYQRSE